MKVITIERFLKKQMLAEVHRPIVFWEDLVYVQRHPLLCKNIIYSSLNLHINKSDIMPKQNEQSV